MSKPSAFFQIKDLYQQAEDLGLRTKVPAQRKLTSTNQGLGLRLSTGTQEPTKKLKKSVVKSSPTVVKHTFASLRKHMQEIKGGLSSSTTLEVVDEDESRTKENKDPATKENEMLTPPSVIDLLTQVENREIDDEESTATIFVGTGGGRPGQTHGLVCSRRAPRKVVWISTWTSKRWVRWPARYLET